MNDAVTPRPVLFAESDVVVTSTSITTKAGTYAARSITGVVVEPAGGGMLVALTLSFTLFFAFVFFPCAFVTFIVALVYAVQWNKRNVTITVGGEKVMLLAAADKAQAERLRLAISGIL